MKLKNLLFLTITALLLLFPGRAAAAESAEHILARCAKAINTAPSISLKFTLEFDKHILPCDLIMSKNKYRLSSKEMQVWYDGATQWTYLTANKQLSITEPTIDELLESNPFAIINNYSKAYTCRKLNGSEQRIELKAKSKATGIQNAIVTVNPKTNLPTKVVVTLSNGTSMTASAATTTVGKLPPSSTFIYNKDKFPAKEIVDLR